MKMEIIQMKLPNVMTSATQTIWFLLHLLMPQQLTSQKSSSLPIVRNDTDNRIDKSDNDPTKDASVVNEQESCPFQFYSRNKIEKS